MVIIKFFVINIINKNKTENTIIFSITTLYFLLNTSAINNKIIITNNIRVS